MQPVGRENVLDRLGLYFIHFVSVVMSNSGCFSLSLFRRSSAVLKNCWDRPQQLL